MRMVRWIYGLDLRLRLVKGTTGSRLIRKKGWYIILRLYDPQETWFNGTWRPGEIEML